ncbi:MAG: GntR family transcriptional regulator [Pyrinomonadaceae bacterium]
MRLWLSKNSEVPLREQLVRQIKLGIASRDLPPGERLPSTRELARRFQIHSNTVSAAYRELARRGWVKFRKGSGVYVSELGTEPKLEGLLELDHLASVFLKTAREKGFGIDEVRSRLEHLLEVQLPDRIVVVEPDPELRRILVEEITEATGLPVLGAAFEDGGAQKQFVGAVVAGMYSHARAIREKLPPGIAPILLHSSSLPEAMKGQKLPPADALVAIVSRWPEFLKWSRAVLIAAGLDADALDFRDARERGWQRGLGECAFVITDAVTVKALPASCDARVFRAVSDESMAELLQLCGL